MRRIRVLIIDDSALVRQILESGLARDPGIEVVGTAADPYLARDKIVELKPDVLTLDVEMPRMDGVEFLRRLMPQYPIPVIMVSSLTERGKTITFDALEAGAVDFVFKPSADRARKLGDILNELSTKIKIASQVNVSHWKEKREQLHSLRKIDVKALSETTDRVIAIGASTGGTEALKTVLSQFPAGAPGIVVVQHMPSGFTRMFAERLNQICAMEVREASHGDRVMPGRILIAEGGKQLRVVRSGGQYQVACTVEEKISGHCPSVDALFQSMAQHVGRNGVGALLTGMGSDGAQGMLAMRKSGAWTFAQDQNTCVVYGMPKAAYELGAVDDMLPLHAVAATVLNACEAPKKPSAAGRA